MRGAAVRRAALPVIFGGVCALGILPLPPVFASAGLDSSWSQALHVAIQQRLAFGTDIVFTFGPLGFTATRLYWPGLFAVTLVFWAALAAGILDAWSGLARKAGRWSLFAWPLLAATVVFASGFAYDIFVFVYLLLWVLHVEAHDEHAAPRLAAHGVLVGAIALSKITFAVAGGVALAMVAVVLVSRRPAWKAVLPAITAALAFLAGWLALSQPLSALPDYLAHSLEIVAGYGEGMGRPGPRWATWTYGLLAGSAWAGVAGYAISRREPRLLAASVFGFAVYAMVWLAMFTRPDDREVAALVFALLAALAFSVRMAPVGGAWAAAARMATYAALATVVVATEIRLPGAILRVPGDVFTRSIDAVGGLADVVQGMPRLQARHEAELARIQRDDPLPLLPGTVDVYSKGQATVFAHGLRWAPRPVFQSYQAYTASLAEMNRRHLLGPRAPDHLLVRVEPIDARLAALEDGASWIDMLERYALREEGGFAVLDRRAAPARATTRRLESWRGEGWRELPREGELQVAAITVHERARNLRSALKRAAVHEIQLRLEDGTVHRFRFLRSAGQAPFVLSPLVASTADFASLFVPCGYGPKPQPVRQVRIMGPNDREVPYTLELQVVTAVPRFEGVPATSVRSLACKVELVDGPQALRTSPFVRDAAHRGLNAHPPATFRFTRPASRIQVCTRLQRVAPDKGSSDGYLMRLVRPGMARAAAEAQVMPEALRRGEETCIEARFPKPVDDVQLRVEGGGHDHWDWVYITRVDLDG